MKGTGSSAGVAGDVVLLLSSSVVDKVLGVVSFFLFPLVDVHRVVTSHLFLFSKSLLRVASVFSPFTKSFRSSSHLLAGLPALHRVFRRDDESRIPLGSFSCPSVWIWSGDPQGFSTFQFLLCFNPICDVVCQHLFIGFFRDSCSVFNPVF